MQETEQNQAIGMRALRIMRALSDVFWSHPSLKTQGNKNYNKVKYENLLVPNLFLFSFFILTPRLDWL